MESSWAQSGTDLTEREKALIAELSEWQEQWKEERKMHVKVKGKVLSPICTYLWK